MEKVTHISELKQPKNDHHHDIPGNETDPDELEAMRLAEIMIAKDKVEVAPEPEPTSFFAGLDIMQHSAARLLGQEFAPLEWTIEDSLLTRTIGFVAGAPGVGKSTFLIQLAASIASGVNCLENVFRFKRQGRVLAVFAEDDKRILQRRLKSLCDQYFSQGYAKTEIANLESRFILPEVTGKDLRFVESTNKGVVETQTYRDFLDMCKGIPDLELIILDPLSRFFSGNENDNNAATFFSTLLERLSSETGASVIMSHHVTKGSTTKEDGSQSLEKALLAEAMRGASGFTGAARWQLNLVSLTVKTARQEIDAQDIRDHAFVAGRVSKKNYGPQEDRFYLERGPGGVFIPAKSKREAEQQNILDDLLRRIKTELREIARKNKKITATRFCYVYPPQWKAETPEATRSNVKAAIEKGLQDNEIFEVEQRNASGKKNHLSDTRAGRSYKHQNPHE